MEDKEYSDMLEEMARAGIVTKPGVADAVASWSISLTGEECGDPFLRLSAAETLPLGPRPGVSLQDMTAW